MKLTPIFYTRIVSTLILAIIAVQFTACNQEQQGASALPESAPITSNGSSNNSNPTVAPTPKVVTPPGGTLPPTPIVNNSGYPSCVSSDPNHICLGLKMVSYQDSAGVPVLSESEALTLVNGMNTIWSQCNIGYQMEEFQITDPSTKGMPYSPDWQNDTNSIRSAYADETRFLVAAVGPWSSGTIAVTMMPDSGIYGTIVDQQYAHNPMTVGHELGHYQGLYHVNDTSNLMSAYIGSNTRALASDQCATARSTDLSSWTAMIRKP